MSHLERIAELAKKHRLPAIGYDRRFTTAGGLMYFGAKPDQNIPHLAAYVDRILKGAKPGDLPVQRPTLFELVINGATARRAFMLTTPRVSRRGSRACARPAPAPALTAHKGDARPRGAGTPGAGRSATLRRRVFAVNGLACPSGGSRLHVITPV